MAILNIVFENPISISDSILQFKQNLNKKAKHLFVPMMLKPNRITGKYTEWMNQKQYEYMNYMFRKFYIKKNKWAKQWHYFQKHEIILLNRLADNFLIIVSFIFCLSCKRFERFYIFYDLHAYIKFNDFDFYHLFNPKESDK